MEKLEIWKSVNLELYREMYSVSNMGRVYGAYRSRALKQKIDRHGYPYVVLCVDGKRKTMKVHRLVALSFIPNPENKPTVNHKNGIRHDNRVSNLEWATLSEQMNDPLTREKRAALDFASFGRMSKGGVKQPVIQKTLDGEIVGRFESIAEAKRLTGASHISCCINGRRKRSGGYKWEAC